MAKTGNRWLNNKNIVSMQLYWIFNFDLNIFDFQQIDVSEIENNKVDPM